MAARRKHLWYHLCKDEPQYAAKQRYNRSLIPSHEKRKVSYPAFRPWVKPLPATAKRAVDQGVVSGWVWGWDGGKLPEVTRPVMALVRQR